MDPRSDTKAGPAEAHRAQALEAAVASALRLQGLDLSFGDPEAILAAAQGNAAAHALVASFPLPDEIEAASVFEA